MTTTEKPYLPPDVLDVLVRIEAGHTMLRIARDTHWSYKAIRRRAQIARDTLGTGRYIEVAIRRARELGLLPDTTN